MYDVPADTRQSIPLVSPVVISILTADTFYISISINCIIALDFIYSITFICYWHRLIRPREQTLILYIMSLYYQWFAL